MFSFILVWTAHDNFERYFLYVIKSLVPCPEGRLIKIINDVRSELELKAQFISSSIDANIAMSMDIPAVSFGIYQGCSAHTMKEYIDANSLELGLRHLVEIVLKLIKG